MTSTALGIQTLVVMGLLASPVLTAKTIGIEITLSSKGNDISFDQTALQVPLGSEVKLKFKNRANIGSEIHHNVAILKMGTEREVIRILQEHDYDDSKIERFIVAKTKMVPPGGEDTIRFTPKKAGYYTYICLMPGHGDILGMKGKLFVARK